MTVRGREAGKKLRAGKIYEMIGEPATAIALYEGLIRDGFTIRPPFERLAILYRKLRRLDDEERIARLAISCMSERAGMWFGKRLVFIRHQRERMAVEQLTRVASQA